MQSQMGVTIGICPLCHKWHSVRKGDAVYIMDAHRISGSDSPWCRGEGLAPEQVSPGCA